MNADLKLPPIGLSRFDAAAHIGVGSNLFQALVDDGRMPRPRQINSRLVWHRREIEEAFEALPRFGTPAERSAGEINSLDAMIARREK
jgi:predicted DNA-binding transcriptional regulator AlpA